VAFVDGIWYRVDKAYEIGRHLLLLHAVVERKVADPETAEYAGFAVALLASIRP